MNELNLPVFSFWITFMILFAVMLLRYFAISGFLYWLCKKLAIKPIDEGEIPAGNIKKDIVWSVLSTGVFALSGTVLIMLWQRDKTQIYYDVREYGWIYYVLSLGIVLFIHDTYFYWTHRLLHFRTLFVKFHQAHHESRIPTAWTSFSFHPVEAIIQAAILPVLMISIPMHWTVLITFLSLMTIFGVLNHLGHETYPGFLEKKLLMISASHHQLHHRKYNNNYGLYFTFWDKLMNTESERA